MLRGHYLAYFIKGIKHRSAKNCKHGERENHHKGFHFYHSLMFLMSFIATKIIDIKTIKTKQIPKIIKAICHFLSSSKLMTRYENIPKKAVKKANEYVFKKSKYSFIFSIRKIIASDYKILLNFKGGAKNDNSNFLSTARHYHGLGFKKMAYAKLLLLNQHWANKSNLERI